jgi:hypothetical protein
METVAERPVDVDLIDAIKRGGQECKFVIRPWRYE